MSYIQLIAALDDGDYPDPQPRATALEQCSAPIPIITCAHEDCVADGVIADCCGDCAVPRAYYCEAHARERGLFEPGDREGHTR